jgi:hypothetical protein
VRHGLEILLQGDADLPATGNEIPSSNRSG